MTAGQRVAVDSTPSLHGIWDTVNATRASENPRISLPPAFYDARALEIIESIVLEEEYVGYKESNEYRTLGIGALLEEAVRTMRDKIHGECPTQSEPMGTFSVNQLQSFRYARKRKRSQRYQARARRMSRLDTISPPGLSGCP